MSDAEKIKELEDKLAAKQGAINELLRALQDKDTENRKLGDDRSKLYSRVDDLERKLKRAEGRLGDRERDHYILLDAMKLLTRAWAEGADLADEVEAALEIGDPKSHIMPRLQEYRTYVAQARKMAMDTYATKAQERMLLQIWKKGELTQELREELGRFMEAHKQTMTDADNWAEIEEIFTRAER
jgi:DNA repair exonuclease SbcCD ATPase subunit